MSRLPELSRIEPSLIGAPWAIAGRGNVLASAEAPAAVNSFLRDRATTYSCQRKGGGGQPAASRHLLRLGGVGSASERGATALPTAEERSSPIESPMLRRAGSCSAMPRIESIT